MTLEEAIKHTKDIEKDVSECTDCRMEHKQLEGWLEELLAYRKMDKQGRLLRLPCKAGDSLYKVVEYVKEPIVEMQVTEVTFENIFGDKTISIETRYYDCNHGMTRSKFSGRNADLILKSGKMIRM